MEVNKIYNEDCLETMARMPDEFIDLTVTSPPYDNLRTYKGYTFDFEAIAKELYRVTKKGGVVVWVVNDATVKGSETGTSFRQALYFKDVCGFNLHDTMIWNKPNAPPQTKVGKRYTLSHEYMFVFSKMAPKSFSPLLIRCKTAGNKSDNKGCHLKANATRSEKRTEARFGKVVKDFKPRYSVWDCSVNTKNIGHPASFPEQLANDHIISWSSEGDLVYDPFMGSGTTAKMALKNNRKFIGSEISEEYCEIANRRVLNESSTVSQ